MMLLINLIYCIDNLPDLMLGGINEYRALNGKHPLNMHFQLVAAAQKQADHMARIKETTHFGPAEGRTFDRRMINAGYECKCGAENVAQDNGNDWESTLDMWINSPTHKANLLGDYNDTGIATVLCSDNKRYWAQVFGSTWERTKIIDPNTNIASKSNEKLTVSYDKAKGTSKYTARHANRFADMQHMDIITQEIVKENKPRENPSQSSSCKIVLKIPQQQIIKKNSNVGSESNAFVSSYIVYEFSTGGIRNGEQISDVNGSINVNEWIRATKKLHIYA